MHPTFDLGFTQLPAYFTLLMVGFTIAILWAHVEGMRRGIDGNAILDMGLLMLACGLIGSRALHVVADGQFWDYVHLCTAPEQVPALSMGPGLRCGSDEQCLAAGLGDLCDAATGLCRQHRDCLRVFKIWYGGYAYYGGFLLAVPVGIWFLRRRGVPVWKFGDVAGFTIAQGLVFGRAGCLLAGCCYGAPTDAGVGLAFPAHSPAWQKHLGEHLIERNALASLPVHATQLYEAVACAAISAFCYWRFRKGVRFDGQVFYYFMFLYAAFRFSVEYLRADDRGLWLGGLLSTSQLISLPLMLWAGWCLVRGRAWPMLDARPAVAAPTPP